MLQYRLMLVLAAALGHLLKRDFIVDAVRECHLLLLVALLLSLFEALEQLVLLLLVRVAHELQELDLLLMLQLLLPPPDLFFLVFHFPFALLAFIGIFRVAPVFGSQVG